MEIACQFYYRKPQLLSLKIKVILFYNHSLSSKKFSVWGEIVSGEGFCVDFQPFILDYGRMLSQEMTYRAGISGAPSQVYFKALSILNIAIKYQPRNVW